MVENKYHCSAAMTTHKIEVMSNGDTDMTLLNRTGKLTNQLKLNDLLLEWKNDQTPSSDYYNSHRSLCNTKS